MQNIAKKIILYLFILITIFTIGFFGWAGKVNAVDGICTVVGVQAYPMTREQCVQKASENSMERFKITWYDLRVGPNPNPSQIETIKEASKEETAASPLGSCMPPDGMGPPTETTQANCTGTWTKNPENNNTDGKKTPFENRLSSSCGANPATWFDGCLLKVFYFIFVQGSALLLLLAAQIFNALISLVIQSSMYTAEFISTAWGVVRDISNIFFILVLLYISIKIILDVGGHEAKQMIAKVIIMALLINFSMFFTKVVIDSSNVLALIFYNKLDTTYKDANGNKVERPNTPSTPYNEKDISGAIYTNFNATKLLDDKFLDEMQTTKVNGRDVKGEYLPFSLTFGIMLIAGSIMLWAAYTFFVAGIFFLGRLIELWVLIIFSPFAFMSFPVPFLNSVSLVGWNEWSKKLLATSFMAPLFMFFIYLIFKLLETNIFNSFTSGKGAMVSLLNIMIPAMILMALLKQATSFAKKGGGMFGELVMTGAKVMGGLALGVATGGVALAGRNTLGWSTAAMSRTEGAKDYGKARIEHSKALADWEKKRKAGATTSAKPTWEQSKQAYQAKTGKQISEFSAIGGRINANQTKSGEIDHARHEMDEIKKKAGLENVGDRFLSGVEEQKLESTFVKENRSNIEGEIRKGYDAKGEEVSVTGNGVTAVGESDYKAKRRKNAIDEVKVADPANIDASGELTDQGKKQVEDKLNSEFNEILRNAAKEMGQKKYKHLQDEAKEKVGMATRIASRSTSGTYDVRNISGLKTDKREGIGAKATIGIVAAIATGMRMGLKKGAGVDVGTPQGNFLKDIGNTISEALKNVKIDIKLGDSGSGAHGPAKNAHAPVDDHGGHH